MTCTWLKVRAGAIAGHAGFLAVGINDVKAVVVRLWVQATTLELLLDPLLVPVLDRIGNVIDQGLAARVVRVAIRRWRATRR